MIFRSLVMLLIASCTEAESEPTMKLTFSFSISSSVRVAASPGLSLSSRTSSSALRPFSPPASPALAPFRPPRLVELGDRDLCGLHLVLRLGAVGAGERRREADPDRRF